MNACHDQCNFFQVEQNAVITYDILLKIFNFFLYDVIYFNYKLTTVMLYFKWNSRYKYMYILIMEEYTMSFPI